MNFLNKFFPDSKEKTLKKYAPFVERVNSFAEDLKKLSNEELSKKTSFFKEQLSSGKTLDEISAEAFAVVREVSDRLLKERHYDVQVIGGKIIHDGNIAEMRTGEGKTLVATLPAYTNSLTGEGVHVVTVNDYLARRDAVWMGQIYSFLGLTVGVINSDGSYLYDPNHQDKDSVRDELGSFKVVHDFLRPVSRQDAYRADITYGTNSEYGFDYLRDNIEYDSKMIRQKNHAFAIVDEIDSILIDEARTPLIISAPTTDSENLYKTFVPIAQNLKQEEDYTVDEKHRAIHLTDSGISKAEKALGIENIYTEKGIKYVHHLETALRAKALFTKDKEYVVRDGEVVIVDEFTGRLQPSRRWSEGLHQAIEAKEGVEIKKESRTYASITYQNYFRLYKKLSGMTGTGKTSAEEFFKVYRLEVVDVPTQRPVARIDRNDFIFQTEKGKWKSLARKVKEIHEKGQPVLIGTVSIEKNEILSEYLKTFGVPHEMLNAKNHEREAEIIAQAGKKGAVTVATNMAGRGVDIKLGGVPFDKEKAEEIKKLGGLFVIGTERHEARRIDNQLRGRSGRQGDPGETQFFVSMEDSLMRIFSSDTVKNMMGRLGIAEDEPIVHGMITRSLENAQTKIEGLNFDARKNILEFDNVLNTQRKSIYSKRLSILLGERKTLDEYLNEIKTIYPEIQKTVEEKISQIGEENFYEVFRRMMLQSIDMFWVDHLEIMDYTRSSVNLRAYGQRDPLIEYQKEGLRLFKEMNAGILDYVAKILPNINAEAFSEEEKKMKETVKNVNLITNQKNTSSDDSTKAKQEGIGRNEIVTIVKNGEEKQVKYKKVDSFLADGWTIKA